MCTGPEPLATAMRPARPVTSTTDHLPYLLRVALSRCSRPRRITSALAHGESFHAARTSARGENIAARQDEAAGQASARASAAATGLAAPADEECHGSSNDRSP